MNGSVLTLARSPIPGAARFFFSSTTPPIPFFDGPGLSSLRMAPDESFFLTLTGRVDVSPTPDPFAG